MPTSQLNAAWWTKNKQVGVTGKELTGALQKLEKKKKTAIASESEKDWKDVKDLLDAIEVAAQKTKGKCNAKLHKKTIGYLDQMLKQVSLEEKTANQMIALAQINTTLQDNVVALRKLGAVAKKAAPLAEKINMTLAKMNRDLPQFLKEKDKKKLSDALRTFTELRSSAKKIKPVSSLDFKTQVVRQSRGATQAVKPPASMKPLIKEILQHRETCLGINTAASEAQSLLSQKLNWFESELKSLKA